MRQAFISATVSTENVKYEHTFYFEVTIILMNSFDIFDQKVCLKNVRLFQVAVFQLSFSYSLLNFKYYYLLKRGEMKYTHLGLRKLIVSKIVQVSCLACLGGGDATEKLVD